MGAFHTLSVNEFRSCRSMEKENERRCLLFYLSHVKERKCLEN